MKTFEFNFIDSKVPQDIVETLMGPFEEDDGEIIPLNQEFSTMAHIMARAGFFRSVGEARKNGWNKPIPSGFSKLVVGKGDRMKVIFILADSPIWHKDMIDDNKL
jgi:hypothetical protein